MSNVLVPRAEWLEYILTKHQPKQLDFGYQRDPWYVTVCTCMEYKDVKDRADKKLIYPRHLAQILEQEYFSRIYSDSR